MPDFLAIAALGSVLTVASIEDLRSREIHWATLAAGVPPALYLALQNLHSPFYLFSLGVALVLALLMRVLGSGYADSVAIALIGSAPPLLPFLPTPFVAVIAGSLLLPLQVGYLYLLNSKRPCKMSPLEKLTHICISKEEFLRKPLKYILGDVKDVEKYDPSKVEVREEWVKAKYGLPYVVYLTAGYWFYVALSLLR